MTFRSVQKALGFFTIFFAKLCIIFKYNMIKSFIRFLNIYDIILLYCKKKKVYIIKYDTFEIRFTQRNVM